ncbi:S1 RNA-binding domain-containing protein 1 isoform X2 [Procambarus clarkii]|uniref:S1 RNA-binding domain-containing protein 1 isoform X2 n=1 Tax=Procambarus clarkii TaxID=6728 RepID=UPI001E6706F1|nr:S1 RNA-binding domain-containing protein 1-like isoform X2 [Procambarus clarkii]
MSTNNALDDSIQILEEVHVAQPLDGNVSIELEVLYDAHGQQVMHPETQQMASQEQQQQSQQQSRLPLRQPPLRPQRQRRPVQQYHQQQQEQEQQAAQLRQQRQQQRQQQLKQQQQQRAQQRQAQQQQQKQQVQQRGIKRKENDVHVVGEVKVQKTGRGEVGGAGTLKYRKRIPDNDVEIIFEWTPAKVIAERQNVEEWVAHNVITMFDQENTLPFIARYRKEKTGNMEVEKLREIQNSYSQLKHVQERVVKILKGDRKKLPEDRKASLLRATTMHEVEHLTAAYKGSGKRTYAERARELGLEPAALEVMQGTHNKFANRQELYGLMDPNREGLRTIEEVEQGLQHIIADVISKDPQVLDCVRQLMKMCKPVLECSKARKQQKRDQGKMVSKGPGPSDDLCSKYENYFEYKNLAWHTKPHAMLAMNRGDHQGVLSVKIVIPDNTYIHFFNFCQQKWLRLAPPHYYRTQLVMTSTEDSWERLVKPFMQRQIRSELTEMAEIASVEVFAANLRKLLLTPPVRGKTILAIDPGFANGCKIGVTNATGEQLLTTTIYPFRGNQQMQTEDWSKDHNARTLREIVHKYGCEMFAVGNGSGCRETETYLTRLISQKCFDPYNVQYTIINETGASQYSCSPEARAEFPGLDPNHISALSLARRLQDPLLEYIKVHPMHMGVGMYQHDIPERILHASLDSVMTECVSFVGVDINSASEFVLRKLSGLNKVRAANIIEYRKTKGPFINREQLKSVKGIGPRTFEQCAGFIRILPETLEMEINRTPQGKKRAEKESINPFDRTMIHPESYAFALKFTSIVGLRQQDIGSEHFIQTVRHFMQTTTLEAVSEQNGTTVPTMQLIVEGLAQPLDYDIRAQFEKPLFRKGITSIDDISLGTKLTGSVRNVTHFGAFVDVGLGNDGLVHSTKMGGMRLELGNIVEVSVIAIEKERGRISLMLERVIG